MASKAIDLGALQDHLILTKKDYQKAIRELERARDNFDMAKRLFEEATESLRNASRTVLE